MPVKPAWASNTQNFWAPHVLEDKGTFYLYYSAELNTKGMGIAVATSKSPMGPFKKMAEVTGKNNSIILQQNERWTGVGHNAVITDAKGQDWIVYHGVDRNNMFIPGTKNVRRPLLIDRIYYRNGWPVIEGNSPSIKVQKVPAL